MSTRPLLQVQLEIDRDVAPVTGEVRMDGAEARRFVGWTELFVALREVIEANTSTNPMGGLNK